MDRPRDQGQPKPWCSRSIVSVSPFFSIAFRCCLRYWLGFYCTFQQQLCVSQPMSFFQLQWADDDIWMVISPWLIDRGTGHLHTHPPCTLRESAWCLGLFNFSLLLLLVNMFFSNNKATSLTFCSWLKGDRPDKGDIEPSSDQPKKRCSRSIVGQINCFTNH